MCCQKGPSNQEQERGTQDHTERVVVYNVGAAAAAAVPAGARREGPKEDGSLKINPPAYDQE